VGSVLLGSKAFIYEARRARKAFGGGMRQAGFLAAAGLYALQNHVERLEEDHVKARKLSDALENISWVKAAMPVETNIVIFEVTDKHPSSYWAEALRKAGVNVSCPAANSIRMVTHLDVSDNDIDRTIAAIAAL
jgi:threonine aldolase